MKKLLLASVAGLALAYGSASAADLAQPPVYKAPAPPPPPTYSWTGCYVEGGGGYGLYTQDHSAETFPGLLGLTVPTTSGGKGWYGTAGAGCDYQFPVGGLGNWLVGAFGDYNFMDLHDTFESSLGPLGGPEKESGSWGVGGRIGYIVTPNLLTYVNGGYTQAHFEQINFSDLAAPFTPLGVDIASHTYDGWFIGGGTETSLSGFLGLSLPAGLFLRSEYRYSTYSSADLPYLVTATGAPIGLAEHMTKYVQTIGTSLVWKFNWAGPVMARY